jgi:hypothetical protein
MAFSNRPAHEIVTGVAGASRFSRMEFPCMLGVSDCAESFESSRWRFHQCGLPSRWTTSALRIDLFRSSMSRLHVPLSTLHEQPCDWPRMTRGQGGSLSLCDSFIHYSIPIFTGAPTRHAGPHRAVQRVTHRQRTNEVDQANRSKRGEAQKTGPDCSPDAKGRVGYPLFVPPGPDRSQVDATSRTVACRTSIASRSWTADDGVSIDQVAVAVRGSDRSRSSSSSP